jgi:hypothetical protein
LAVVGGAEEVSTRADRPDVKTDAGYLATKPPHGDIEVVGAGSEPRPGMGRQLVSADHRAKSLDQGCHEAPLYLGELDAGSCIFQGPAAMDDRALVVAVTGPSLERPDSSVAVGTRNRETHPILQHVHADRGIGLGLDQEEAGMTQPGEMDTQ